VSDGRTEQKARNTRRTTLLLSLLVFVMFGFGFALVPLYDLICQVTGVQSITLRSRVETVAGEATKTDTTRWITVKFDTSIHPDLPWKFRVADAKMRVHPGSIYEINFLADNRSSDRITGQAIPSVAPWQATPYFSKIECFCFEQQTLTGGETAIMPLRFMISPDLPADISSITLSYNLMKIKIDDKAIADTSVDSG